MSDPTEIVANAIRIADGNHSLGAAQIAEVAIRALAEAGYVVVRASRVDLGGSIIGSVPPHAEEVMWTGDNVEEITRLTGCSAEDVRKYIPPGSRVWRAGNGWNYSENGKATDA